MASANIFSTGANRTIKTMWVVSGGANRQVKQMYVFSGGANRLVYQSAYNLTVGTEGTNSRGWVSGIFGALDRTDLGGRTIVRLWIPDAGTTFQLSLSGLTSPPSSLFTSVVINGVTYLKSAASGSGAGLGNGSTGNWDFSWAKGSLALTTGVVYPVVINT